MEIPRLDVSKIGLLSDSPSKEDINYCGIELFEAFSKCGFIYIANHGINDTEITNAFKASKDFFLQPDEKKNNVKKGDDVDQGWVSAGREIFDQSASGKVIS